MTIALNLDALDFSKSNGLVTIVAQDSVTGALLMVAGANREALELTISTGQMHYTSRTRGLWHKGATSGNVQRVISLAADCDGDAVLARVQPAGPACHTGQVSCFGATAMAADALGTLDATIAARVNSNTTATSADIDATTAAHTDRANSGTNRSYTQRLLTDRNLRLKKLGEEMAELVTACADNDAARATEEGADVIYHALVALRAVGVSLNDVRQVLDGRAQRAG